MNALRMISQLKPLARLSSTSSTAQFVNRNPRNLERMRIARKPAGYHLDKPGRSYWHKLVLTTSQRSVKAQIVHFLNGPVIEAKSTEWAIRKQLYSTIDTSAYINLGQILAQRCLESGITEVSCDIEGANAGKVRMFLNEVKKSGIRLKEPEQYVKPNPWDRTRPEKPWEVTE
ncbi:hypothetical protein JYU34_011655 [Plutella xylostella]|uniref:39S ribosomal protein L18, mitochondrial n=1 Tax=Plutella xylostella TaxID=51655 RepID=A0ABQ7QD94_PLUXY|nr:hypothetical protein JYU34_011655 [Plutella xylostella]